MPANMSRLGKIEVFEDFLHFEDNIAATGAASGIVNGTGYVSVGDVGLVSVNEGSLAWTIDEPGGILALTTDTGDDDNDFLVAGRFEPNDGGCVAEFRFKIDSITEGAIYAGFCETLAFDTPVMPAEFATATMTYNGTGGMVGFNWDPDGTTDDFRALQGDGAAGGTGSGTTGVRASDAVVVDEWFTARVELDPAGTSRCYLGHKGGANGVMNLVQEFTTAGITPTDQFYATLGCENRGANANVFEVDYFYAQGWRDWAVT